MTQLSYSELDAQSVPKARLEEATLPQTQFLQWYRIQVQQIQLNSDRLSYVKA
jgi:hypothetical protein